MKFWLFAKLGQWLASLFADSVMSDPLEAGGDNSADWEVDAPDSSFDVLLAVDAVQEPVLRLATAFPHLKIDALKRFAERIVNLPHGKTATLHLQVANATEVRVHLAKVIKDSVALDFASSSDAIAKIRAIFAPETPAGNDAGSGP